MNPVHTKRTSHRSTGMKGTIEMPTDYSGKKHPYTVKGKAAANAANKKAKKTANKTAKKKTSRNK